jgi:retron-type reverse transcriptase
MPDGLIEIHHVWKGTKWFIEGDIKGCFDNIDHHTLMSILRENIQDNRFLRLIEGALKAGYCEEWKYHPSHSGSPQGGIVSPILSNIYMDRLDKFVEETLIPAYTRKDEREENPIYNRLRNQGLYWKAKGDLERARELRKEAQQHPSRNPNDPEYRRLRYVRYADGTPVQA